ncbi:MAG: response regulator [Rhodospirillales bacterium]|nr:response regulator [Rhodospirillales bacterium]
MIEIKIPFYRRLTSKFLAMALVLFVAPQLVLYFYSSNAAREMLIGSLKNDLKEKSFLVGADIDRFFRQRVHDVRILSQSEVLEASDVGNITRYLAEIKKETPNLDAIDVIDLDGRIIVSSGEPEEQGRYLQGLHPELSNLFTKALAAKQGDLFVSKVLQLDHGAGLIFLTPITDDATMSVIKILLVKINLDTVKKIVADFDDRVVGDEHVYLVDNLGRVIISADPETHLFSNFPDLVVQPGLLKHFSQQGDVGSVIYKDVDGHAVMAGFADMAEFGVNKAMGWSIIAKARLEDITRPVLAFENVLLGVTALIFVIVTAVMLMTSRSIVGSVSRLVNGARRIGAGEIGFRMDAVVNDEFGYLAGTINQTMDKLTHAQKAAEAANIAKSNFLATMSHEIRTPLNGVLGVAQLLNHTKLDQEQQKNVETILASGRTLLAVISDVLDISRIEAGGMELEEAPFGFRGLMSTVSSPFQSLADDKGIKLRVFDHIDPGLIVRGDQVRLRQVFWNLLSNAIKFTDVGGVTVTIDNIGPGGNPVPKPKAHLIHFSIADTGLGIAPDRVSKIFDPFTQEDSSITRKFGGTGLGLSIVKQLVELMGGKIEVESVINEGTKFDVYIPFEKVTEDDINVLLMQAPDSDSADTGPLNVLVAEDNAVNAMIAKGFLKKLGHQVRHAEDGRQAVEMAAENWADLIFMDIHMPEMDGMEATQAIRSSETGATIPIIALTAEAFTKRHEQFMAAGMNGVLTKPFTEDQLVKIIDLHRQRGGAFSNAPGSQAIDKDKTGNQSNAEQPESAPIGNDEEFEAFKQIMDSEMISDLLGEAVKSLQTRMEEIRQGLESSDSEIIRLAAHSIKGSSGSIFAVRVSKIASTVEENSTDLAAIGKLMPTFEKAAEDTVQWWQSKLD